VPGRGLGRVRVHWAGKLKRLSHLDPLSNSRSGCRMLRGYDFETRDTR
jgi:hypothetical protein